MGSGIAEVLAKSGMTVQLLDRNAELAERGYQRMNQSLAKALAKGKIANLQAAERVTPGTIGDARPAQLVIEAIHENMDAKKEMLRYFGPMLPEAVIASNTSSLSLTELAASCSRSERVIGMHFFNPPPVMELLEVVKAEQTSPETLEKSLQWARLWGKTPIVVNDVPGFASSRLGIILGMEAIRMLESGVASAEDIDKAMELGYRHPMGPLRLTDLVGLDVRLAIAEHLTKEVGPQFTPPPLLRRLVRAGRLGKKVGHGFYRWEQA